MLRVDSVIRRSGEYQLRWDGEEIRLFGPPRPEREDLLPDPLEHPPEDFPKVEMTVVAGSWVEAKAAMGFVLTGLQQRMIAHEASHYELTGHTWGDRDER